MYLFPAAETNPINWLSSLLHATCRPPPSVITPKHGLYCITIIFLSSSMNYHWPRCRPGAQPLFTNNHLQTCRWKLSAAVLRLPCDLCCYRRGMKHLCFSSHQHQIVGHPLCHNVSGAFVWFYAEPITDPGLHLGLARLHLRFEERLSISLQAA